MEDPPIQITNNEVITDKDKTEISIDLNIPVITEADIIDENYDGGYPFLPEKFGSKKIDFVLVYNEFNVDDKEENKKKQKRNDFLRQLQNFDDNVRTSIKKNHTFESESINNKEVIPKLKLELYKVEMSKVGQVLSGEDVPKHSSGVEGRTVFILVHVPFHTCEKYAEQLNIMKNIKDIFIDIVYGTTAPLGEDKLASELRSSTNQGKMELQNRDESLHIGNVVEFLSTRNQKNLLLEQGQDRHIRASRKEEQLRIQQDFVGPVSVTSKIKNWIDPSNVLKRKIRESGYTQAYSTSYNTIFENFEICKDVNENGHNCSSHQSDDFFSSNERITIANSILVETQHSGAEKADEKEMGIDSLIADGVFTKYYPLHDGSINELHQNETETLEQQQEPPIQQGQMTKVTKPTSQRVNLYTSWGSLRSMFSQQPLDEIQEYFSEEIAYYFAFLGFYTSFLCLASLFSVLALITNSRDEDYNKIIDELKVSDASMCPACETCNTTLAKDYVFNLRMLRYMESGSSLMYCFLFLTGFALFVEFWKRKTYKKAFDWDLTDKVATTKPIRPEYTNKAEQIYTENMKVGGKKSNKQYSFIDLLHTDFDPVTLKIRKVIPESYKTKLRLISVTMQVLFIVIFIIGGLFVYEIVRATLKRKFCTDQDSFLCKYYGDLLIAIPVQMIILLIGNHLYTWYCTWQVNQEFHETVEAHQDALTSKMFRFNFVNFFTPVFYTAFVKPLLETYPGNYTKIFGLRLVGCVGGSCSFDLVFQIFCFMSVRTIGTQIIESTMPVIMPLISRSLAASSKEAAQIRKSKQTRKVPRWERDYPLEKITELTLFYEYLEMVIQYGYICLFIVACPISPILAFLNNIVEIREDANKFIVHRQRPVPKQRYESHGIGAWQKYLSYILKFAVVTNPFILLITMWSGRIKVWSMYNSLGSTNNNNNTQLFEDFYGTEFPLSCLDETNKNVTGTNGTCLVWVQRDLANNTDIDTCPNSTPNRIFWGNTILNLLYFVIVEHVLFALLLVIDVYIKDEPAGLKKQAALERQVVVLLSKVNQTDIKQIAHDMKFLKGPTTNKVQTLHSIEESTEITNKMDDNQEGKMEELQSVQVEIPLAGNIGIPMAGNMQGPTLNNVQTLDSIEESTAITNKMDDDQEGKGKMEELQLVQVEIPLAGNMGIPMDGNMQ